MNILNISTFDSNGAGIAAFRTHNNFQNHGHNSKFLVFYSKNRNNDDIITVHNKLTWFIYRFKRKIRNNFFISNKIKTNYNYYFLQNNANNKSNFVKILLKKIPFTPEIIILYWVNQFINSKDILKLNSLIKVPIIWYFLDMTPMTGGCHYAWDCNGYKNSCGNCPGLFSTNERDLSYLNLKCNHKYLKQTNITVVAPTEWLYKQAKSSSIFKDKNIHKIMLAIDSEIFKPVNKIITRKRMDLPLESKIIFFGSNFLEERKGMLYLLNALKYLKKILLNSKLNYSIFLLIAGNNNEDLFNELPFNYRYVGKLKNNIELTSAYQAADVFANPSIEDSGPMMINESIMCGTPVVSFDMGVAPDLVHNNITGYRAKLKNSEDFAKGLFKLLNLNNDEYNKMSKKCRELGIIKCHPDVQIKNFEKLFNSLLR